jgi:hypothetical protein
MGAFCFDNRRNCLMRVEFVWKGKNNPETVFVDFFFLLHTRKAPYKQQRNFHINWDKSILRAFFFACLKIELDINSGWNNSDEGSNWIACGEIIKNFSTLLAICNEISFYRFHSKCVWEVHGNWLKTNLRFKKRVELIESEMYGGKFCRWHQSD